MRRVRGWRQSNPDFGRRKKMKEKVEKERVLRDFVRGGKGSKDDVLRDVLFFHMCCFQGLMSNLTGALRDDIGPVMMRFYDRGKELVPELENLLKQGVCSHDPKGDREPRPAPEAAGGVRVGRSPPGA